jgi:transcriptional regulator with XRE-family HTH domain
MGRRRSANPKRAARSHTLPERERALLAALGARVAALRKQTGGMSTAELARRAVLNPSFLGDVERGHANVSFLTLVRIAAALGVELAALLGPLSDRTPSNSDQHLADSRVDDASSSR